MRRAGLTDAAVGHAAGDHLCWLYDGQEAWVDLVVDFFVDGVRHDERLLYVADQDPARSVDDLDRLPDRDAMLATGQLKVLPHARDGDDTFRAAKQIAAFDAATRDALQDGYRSLRIAADPTPFATTEGNARRFAEYEFLLDMMVVQRSVSVLCGYDAQLVRGRAARDLCFVHPLRHADRHVVPASIYAEGSGTWRLEGEVDIAIHAVLEDTLSAVPAVEEVHMELDDLRFIDVAGTRALVSLAQRLHPTGRLVLHDPPYTLMRVLDSGWGEVPGLQVVRS